jgi:epoxyqueuosine reductase
MTALATLTLTDSVKALARELGFDRVAIGPAGPPEHGQEFRRWLEAGYGATMGYLRRRAEERVSPHLVLPGARSVVCVALNYFQGDPPPDPSWAPVARYAWGRDYHDVMLPRLERIARALDARAGSRSKAYVDTGPVLERDLAARAGLGWIGKNTMLLHPGLGSWFLIGVILTTAALAADAPEPDRCGSCRACLEACPTGALVAPYVLDARRCISYLTIEHRGPIPEGLEADLGGWEFGCDVCQAVCPWNRKAPLTRERSLEPEAPYPGAAVMAGLDDAGFALRFGASALRRAGAGGMRRNAAIALANRAGRPETDQPGGEHDDRLQA